MLALHPTLPEGQVLDARYRVDEPLGVGGHGQVYRGTQLSTGRAVALKVLRPELLDDPIAVKRFEHEARFACQLSHPNLVTYYDFGRDPELGAMYVVMELLPGESLAEHVRATGPMGLARVARIVEQVGGALHEAHEAGLVHRDVKPANLMLVREGAQGDFVKVIDFGLVKAFRAGDGQVTSLTADGVIVGSPYYLSPEQIREHGDIDGRADVYALACTAYKLLTGLTPFRGRDPVEVATQHLLKAPRPMGAVLANSDFPSELEALIAEALAKEPDERPATALEFARRFSEAAARAPERVVHRGHATLLDAEPPDLKPRRRPRRAAEIPTAPMAERSPVAEAPTAWRPRLLKGAVALVATALVAALALLLLKVFAGSP